MEKKRLTLSEDKCVVLAINSKPIEAIPTLLVNKKEMKIEGGLSRRCIQ